MFKSYPMNKGEKHRCQVLDMNGKQCKNEAVRKVNYHGDSEIYPHNYDKPSATWVKVFVCQKHLDSV